MADTDWLKLSQSILTIPAPYLQGSARSTAGKYEAQQHYQNVKSRLYAGEQQAGAIRQAGRSTASDATVAMIAQGGTVDSSMLAKIKKESDIDAIGALYDAKADALTQQHAGRVAEMQAKHEYRAGVLGSVSNILGAASTYKWKGKPTSKGAKATPLGKDTNDTHRPKATPLKSY